MYPTIVRLGSFEVSSFGVLVALAFLAAALVLRRESERLALPLELPNRLVVAAIIGGLLGAKLYFLGLYWPATVAHPWRAITARSGLVWYGGFLGATITILLTLRRQRVAILPVADACAPALALGYAIGRLGCFLVGDDYGRPTALPWGVRFTAGPTPSTVANLRADFGVHVPLGLPDDTVLAVHPTQLYETVLMGTAFVVLWKLRRDPRLKGRLFALYLVFAGIERFLIEALRAKDDRLLGPFTVAQLLSVLAMAAGLVWLRRRREPAPAAA